MLEAIYSFSLLCKASEVSCIIIFEGSVARPSLPHHWLSRVAPEHLPTVPGGVTACEHGPLPALPADGEKQYISANSLLVDTLRDVVLDKNFITKIPYYLNVK